MLSNNYIIYNVYMERDINFTKSTRYVSEVLLQYGITSLIGFQAIINIAVVTSIFPVTGMALPFFSYGGSSLIILLSSVGILLNISKQQKT